jgi:hypothetical protein
VKIETQKSANRNFEIFFFNDPNVINNKISAMDKVEMAREYNIDKKKKFYYRNINKLIHDIEMCLYNMALDEEFIHFK